MRRLCGCRLRPPPVGGGGRLRPRRRPPAAAALRRRRPPPPKAAAASARGGGRLRPRRRPPRPQAAAASARGGGRLVLRRQPPRPPPRRNGCRRGSRLAAARILTRVALILLPALAPTACLSTPTDRWSARSSASGRVTSSHSWARESGRSMALAGSACCSSLTATPRIGLTRRDAVPKHTPLSAHACARACACVAPAEPLRARREPVGMRRRCSSTCASTTSTA